MLKYLVTSYYYYKLQRILSKNIKTLSVQVCFLTLKDAVFKYTKWFFLSLTLISTAYISNQPWHQLKLSNNSKNY